MQKLKKLSLFCSLLACVFAFVCACGNGSTSSDGTSQSSDATTENTEITSVTEETTATTEPPVTVTDAELDLTFDQVGICASKTGVGIEGKFAKYDSWYSTDYVDIRGYYGIEYELAAHKNIMSVAFYDENQKYIDGIGTESVLSYATVVQGLVTVPENAVYARFVQFKGSSSMPAMETEYVKAYASEASYNTALSARKYNGLKIVCIGDSLTEGDHGSGISGVANRQLKTYPYYLSKLLGCETVNDGRCGITSSGYLTLYNGGTVNVSDADVVLIMLGTNKGLGDSYGTSYSTLVDKVQADMKDGAVLVLITPPTTTVEANIPYVEGAHEFVLNLAKEKNLPVIDAYTDSPIQTINVYIYQSNDGLHMNEQGYAAFAEFIAAELEEILK